MAKIFSKIKENIAKKKPEAQETPVVESEARMTATDNTPGQQKRREEFLAAISEGHSLPEEFAGLTKDVAREQLRKHIEERISSVNSTAQEEELKRISEERERQRKELAEGGSSRRKKREKAHVEKAKEEPLVIEEGVFAVYKPEPEKTPSPSIDQIVARDTVQLNLLKEAVEEIQQAKEEEESGDVMLEGQVAFKDLGGHIEKEEEKEPEIAPPKPDITEQTYSELFEVQEDNFDKVLVAIKKFSVGSYRRVRYIVRAIVYFFTGIFEVQIKTPGKPHQITMRIEGREATVSGKTHYRWVTKLIETKDRVVQAERRFSDKLAHIVTRVDKKQDENAKKAEEAVMIGSMKAHRLRHWMDVHKRGLLMVFASGVAACILIVAGINWATAYEYSYNGKTLGVVKSQEDVLEILDIVSKQLSKEHNAEVFIDKDEDIKFKKVLDLFGEPDSQEEVLRTLTYMQDMSVIGYSIRVEGRNIGIVESEKAARSILEEVQSMYAPESSSVKYEDVGFAENIEIVPVETKLGRLLSHDDALYKILTGSEEQKVHIVQSGETFSSIAKMYGLSQSNLQASNPTITPERLSIGQEIILTQALPLLTVQTVEVATYIEYIPYATTYEDDSSMYQGETSTRRAGQNGEKSVTAKIVRNNGVEVAKLELYSSITKQPVDAIIRKGTKALPPKKGTGKFIYPVSGFRLTSKFGLRWGRMHYGIDLACPTGTKIRAADGGVVKFSGYSGSYGYVVKIDHGGGFVTVYAHCSKLFVKVGESVYQGQHIANVGSTGRSTGPHCHFEVQYLGTPKNPLNYL